MRTLSGGNQQKVVLARWLLRELQGPAARRAHPWRRRRRPLRDLRPRPQSSPTAASPWSWSPARSRRSSASPTASWSSPREAVLHEGPEHRDRRARRARHHHERRRRMSVDATAHERCPRTQTDRPRPTRTASRRWRGGPAPEPHHRPARQLLRPQPRARDRPRAALRRRPRPRPVTGSARLDNAMTILRLAVGDRRRQHRHDLRHLRWRHRPVRRRHRRALVGLGDDASPPRRWPRTSTGSSWCSPRSSSGPRAASSTACSSPMAGSPRSSSPWRCWLPRAGSPRSSPSGAPRSSATATSSTSSTAASSACPVLVIIFALVAVVGWLLLNRTTFGRRTLAVGGNPEAARLAGIKVQRQTHVPLRPARRRVRHRRRHDHGAHDHRLVDARRALRARRPSLPSSSAAPCSAVAAAPSSAPSSASSSSRR